LGTGGERGTDVGERNGSPWRHAASHAASISAGGQAPAAAAAAAAAARVAFFGGAVTLGAGSHFGNHHGEALFRGVRAQSRGFQFEFKLLRFVCGRIGRRYIRLALARAGTAGRIVDSLVEGIRGGVLQGGCFLGRPAWA
jgi:hypothetical protein